MEQYTNLTADSEYNQFIEQLYSSFQDGHAFESFLPVLLIRMGFQEATVTGKSGDGGVDLKAVRAGIEDISAIDQAQYVVQAKRYKPGTTVPIRDVREFRGVINQNTKGLFITTARFTKRTQQFAGEDETRPILLIDGRALVQLCIKYKLGFRYKPVFDGALLKSQVSAVSISAPKTRQLEQGDEQVYLKTITANDIRARIITLPVGLSAKLADATRELIVEFPPHFAAKSYTYQRKRKYLGGVTEVLRKFSLLGEAGVMVPKLAQWVVSPDLSLIRVFIQEGVE